MRGICHESPTTSDCAERANPMHPMGDFNSSQFSPSFNESIRDGGPNRILSLAIAFTTSMFAFSTAVTAEDEEKLLRFQCSCVATASLTTFGGARSLSLIHISEPTRPY